MKDPFLVGEAIYLRPISESDCDGAYPDWLNDYIVCQGNSHGTFPYTRDEARRFVASASSREDSLVLAIVTRDGDRHIGNASLDSIHRINRSATFGILIGDRGDWGKGIGREVGRMLLDHGFLTLNLHRISCGTFENNRAMQRLALSLGMKEEGRRRAAVYKAGRWLDVLEYGILQEEYLQETRPRSMNGKIADLDGSDGARDAR